MRDLVIVGNGGHAKVVIDILEERGGSVVMKIGMNALFIKSSIGAVVEFIQ